MIDLEYIVPNDINLIKLINPNQFVVDYNFIRLSAVHQSKIQCCELADLEGKQLFNSIRMNIIPFLSNIQIAYDLSMAAKLITPNGHIEIRIFEQKLLHAIQKLCAEYFNVITVKKSHYLSLFCSQPTEQPPPMIYSSIKTFDVISNNTLEFDTRSGLFSYEEIDPGTELLLSIDLNIQNANLLDLGCGYGAIGVTLAGRKALVTMIDVDSRAVSLARQNLNKNKLTGNVIIHDASIPLSINNFDIIYSNLPTHAGSDMLKKVIHSILKMLSTEGFAIVVVREHLNYEKWLNGIARFERIRTESGYKIIKIWKMQK